MQITNARINILRDRNTTDDCVSIYMQTDPVYGGETKKHNVTRLKNAIQALQRKAKADDKQLDEIFTQLHSLLEDNAFWQQQDAGLALFADKQQCMRVRLPFAINDFSVLGSAFVISPLIAMKSLSHEFYLLDINLKTKPRLLRTTSKTLVEVHPDEMPQSFEQITARYEYNTDLSFKGAPRNTPGSGDSASFHGPDTQRELDVNKRAYLRDITHAVDSFLKDKERPLVLAGTEERVGNLRKELRYHTVLQEYIAGDVGEEGESMLYRRALPLVMAYRRNVINESVRQLLASNPNRTLVDYDAITKAARENRVEQLYVPLYHHTQVADEASTITLDFPDNELESLEALI